jgi:uncharacterized membrane protein (UPF0127 family)
MRASLLLLVALAAECQRTPPEEFAPRSSSETAPADTSPHRPDPSSVPSSEPVRDAAPSRCMRPTPADAPARVPPGPAPGCPADPEASPPKVPVVRVTFPEAGGAAVDAEFVRSEHDTMRGLMYRTTMNDDRGMLFDLRLREDHKFWMHNTCIPLDLLYVDFDGFVVGIVENAPTLNDESRGVGCASRFVLEVNAGWTRRHGVKAGQRMTLPALTP